MFFGRIGLFCITILFTIGFHAAWSATISWVPNADGNWEIPGNWDLGVPGSGDDAMIDVGGATVRTITIGSGSQSINSVTSQENLHITGGDLTINGSGTSTINGDLILGTGRILTVTDGMFVANGSTTIDASNLYANTGGSLVLSNATSYSGASQTNYIQAEGTDSVVDLSGLTSFAGSTVFSKITVRARSGGKVVAPTKFWPNFDV